ncbi:alternative ribosome rescue aminoacyl-tRNA hydrolase ArfB [Petrimonas sp.]|uniref:alternative ribosome rescue aminoacyl-tRNA hydrolase ArfB n=1 Tax=Petrimonas sp. TaxID=2023866 RepID=UPI003F50FD5A
MIADIDKLIDECTFTTVRSSGSGGQNVNKVETKVLLSFDVLNSQVLSEEQKSIISKKLKNRINKDGILQISSDVERSQIMNKKAVVAKLEKLLTKALHVDEKRIATKRTLKSIQKRLDDKKRQAEKKRLRSEDF